MFLEIFILFLAFIFIWYKRSYYVHPSLMKIPGPKRHFMIGTLEMLSKKKQKQKKKKKRFEINTKKKKRIRNTNIFMGRFLQKQ